MTVLPIHITGSPVLHQPAAPVTAVDDSLRELLADMVDTMHAAPGVGLAAPQVGAGIQLFVWDWEDDEGHSHGHVVNPSLTLSGWPSGALSGRAPEEGCLSLPGLRAPLARKPRARLTGRTIDGEVVDVVAEGWLARIFQHEYDHLQGVLYRDRLSSPQRRIVDAEVHQSGWGLPGHSWTPGPGSRESHFLPEDD